MQVFAERGCDAATTREVAQAAGVNEQLIQRYFGGKGGLLLAIIERFGEEERRSCALPPPCDCVEAEIQGFLDFQHTWLGGAIIFASSVCIADRERQVTRLPR